MSELDDFNERMTDLLDRMDKMMAAITARLAIVEMPPITFTDADTTRDLNMAIELLNRDA